MNKIRFAFLTLACLTVAAGQSFDSSANSSLNGTYFLRELAFTVSSQGAITRAFSVSGPIVFDGNGKYTFNGQLLDSSKSTTQPSSYTVSGGYSVAANGMAQIQSLIADQDFIFGAFTQSVFIGSSTEGQLNDLIIAIPAGVGASNAALQGSYRVGAIEFPQGNVAMVRDSYFTLTADGGGNMSNVTVNGSAAKGCQGLTPPGSHGLGPHPPPARRYTEGEGAPCPAARRPSRMKRALLLLALPLLLPTPAPAAGPGRPAGPRFEVEVVKDLPYYEGKDADPAKHKLDLYYPKGRVGYPVLFFVHGGAWRFGDRRIYAPLGEVFARHGVGAVIVSYRLSPKVKHPAHVEDVARAFAWVHQHIARYGGNPGQVFVCGHSAGGHLVALLATDASYLKVHKLGLNSIRGVLALSGVYLIIPGAARSAFGADGEVCRNASPLCHVGGKRPPFLLLYADRDYPTLGWMAERMAAALRRHKCEAQTLEVKGRTHVSLIIGVAKGDSTARLLLRFIESHGGAKAAVK